MAASWHGWWPFESPDPDGVARGCIAFFYTPMFVVMFYAPLRASIEFGLRPYLDNARRRARQVRAFLLREAENPPPPRVVP